MADPGHCDTTNKKPNDEVDNVRDQGAQSQQADVDLGIAKDPSEQEDGASDVPEEQGLPEVEREIRQAISHGVLLARHVLQAIGKVLEEGASLAVEFDQSSILDLEPTF